MHHLLTVRSLALAACLLAASGFLAVVAQVPSGESDENLAKTAATDFLKNYGASRKAGLAGIPTQKQLTQLQRFFTTSLRASFAAALKEQQRCIRRFPSDKPPWIEGDIFSSNFEGFDTFAIESASIDNESAMLLIKYLSKGAKGEPDTSWQDALFLKKIATKWLVDDMQYRGDFAFGSGFGVSLRQSLQSIPAC
jgi:hypothetical protein